MTNFDVKLTGIEMTEAIRSYLDKRLEKIDKFIGDDPSAKGQVEIGKTTQGQNKGEIFKAEINLHIAGKSLRTVEEDSDLYSAIDKTQEEMIRSLKSYKGKQRSMMRRGGYQIKKLLKFRGKKYYENDDE